MDTLKRVEIDGNNLRVIQSLYWDQVAAVRIKGGLSQELCKIGLYTVTVSKVI